MAYVVFIDNCIFKTNYVISNGIMPAIIPNLAKRKDPADRAGSFARQTASGRQDPE